MGDILDVLWPVTPFASERLVVRPVAAGDRSGCVELLCSPEVRRFLGGPLERSHVEAELPEPMIAQPGHFAAEENRRFLGTVSLSRRPQTRPGHLSADGRELEVSYTFMPEAWGCGYASEAVAAVLEWSARVLPGEPVVLCTQAANAASVRLAERLGFVWCQQFEEFGAQQWFGVRAP